MPMNQAEPWLRGTLGEVSAVQRAVLHALELAREDIDKWCGDLSDEELNARPFGLAPVAFHICHIAGSVDRLLTYAEGTQLLPEQLTALKSEIEFCAERDVLMAEFRRALNTAARRIRAFDASLMEQSREVGKKKLPTTVGGLLVHIADHTQRHAGQAITTAQLSIALRRNSYPEKAVPGLDAERQAEFRNSMPLE